jgi:hypothetical protein
MLICGFAAFLFFCHSERSEESLAYEILHLIDSLFNLGSFKRSFTAFRMTNYFSFNSKVGASPTCPKHYPS